MNVFHDLIEELKDENLLEDTVIDLDQADVMSGSVERRGMNSSPGFSNETEGMSVKDEDDDLLEIDIPHIEKPANERDFFRKRAMDEVSSLQMVEHVLSGVEREHMKTTPVLFDDMDAKKALHRFMQVSGDLKSPEHAEAEFALRQETERWSFALFERDQKISVANIRRFCEDSRPVLSSQALISLARFYRNSPYSEDVRGKFDFVMTRLFSRDTDDETRRLLFPMQEMIGHISTLYANWSSIALYSNDADQVDVSLAVTRFNEFGVEIENAETFDELLETDFFSKVRLYKEESAEMFYVPDVAAAAIECNLKIGNRYVELIDLEAATKDVQSIEEKYGYTYDQVVSNAAGKTLLLVELLRLRPEDGDFRQAEVFPAFRPSAKPAMAEKRKSKSELKFEIFGVNKWLMVVAFLCISVSVGVYLWADKSASNDESTAVAKPLVIDDPEVKKHLRSMRSSGETVYALTQPTFDVLSQEEQKEFLQKVYKLANERNMKKVNLLNNKGRTVAYASKDRLELIAK